mgnify:CR=1 FL=1
MLLRVSLAGAPAGWLSRELARAVGRRPSSPRAISPSMCRAVDAARARRVPRSPMNALFATVSAPFTYASARCCSSASSCSRSPVAGKGPTSGGGAQPDLDPGQGPAALPALMQSASVVAGIASGDRVAFALAAVSMSGLPAAGALDRATLALVTSASIDLRELRGWCASGPAVALCALLFAAREIAAARHRVRRHARHAPHRRDYLARCHGPVMRPRATDSTATSGQSSRILVHSLAAARCEGAARALVNFLLAASRRSCQAARATRHFDHRWGRCAFLLRNGGGRRQ